MTISLGPLGQVALSVDDVDAAELFYRDVLGLRWLYRFADLVFFDCAGVRLLVSRPETGAFAPSASPLYFRVPDLALATRELEGRGVTFVQAPHLVAPMVDHDLWMAFFRDPAGNALALMQEAPKGYDPTA